MTLHPIPEERLTLIREDLVALHGQFDLLRATDRLAFESVLDIGFGRGGAAICFASVGKSVTALSLTEVGVGYPREIADQDYPADLMDEVGIQRDGTDFHVFAAAPGTFDAIWAAHVLEHTLDCGQFLRRCHRLLSTEGWLLLSVPPFKHQVVMGHLSVGWNIGLLMHALAVTGFNVRDGHYLKHGYDLAAYVQKGNALGPLIERGASFDELSVTAFQEPYRRACWPFHATQGFEATSTPSTGSGPKATRRRSRRRIGGGGRLSAGGDRRARRLSDADLRWGPPCATGQAAEAALDGVGGVVEEQVEDRHHHEREQGGREHARPGGDRHGGAAL